jgi:hypothetical protein
MDPDAEQTNIANITYELNDALKALACRELSIDARFNESSHYAMSDRHEYSYYHKKLDAHLKRNSSSEMDYFAFTILLTYPPERIIELQSWRDLKLYRGDSSGEADFEIIGVSVSSGGDDGPSNYTCICSHHIQNIYKLRNKLSMRSFQVGSECIKRAGLVSSDTLKSHKKLMDAQIERQKEISEGRPIGYYEELRKNEKDEKKRAKQIKKDERERAKQLKTEEKEIAQLIQLERDGNACSKKCLVCNADRLFRTSDDIRICNICVKKTPKRDKKKYVDQLNNPKNYIEDKCNGCEKLFTYCCQKGDKYLCSDCENTKKIIKCKRCYDLFVDVITSQDDTCEECDAKLKCCGCCLNMFIPEIESNLRCKVCQLKFDNNLITIKCSECDIGFDVKDVDKKWKKSCGECFKNNQKYVDCSICYSQFKRLITDTWKTKCHTCHVKRKNAYLLSED